MATVPRAEVLRSTNVLFSSTKTDAWTIGLKQLIQEQVCVSMPSISATECDMEELSNQMMELYLPAGGSPSDRARREDSAVGLKKLHEKIRESCLEVQWDLLLSSLVISMRPVVVQESNSEQEAQVEHVETAPIPKAPPFALSFFTPRPALTNSVKKKKSALISNSARWLLSEWQVGSDPKEYVFKHPYVDVSESEEYMSQSELEQGSSDRRRSRSISEVQRNDSEFNGMPADNLPPTIASASQPVFASAIPSHLTRNKFSHSQPIHSFSTSPSPASQPSSTRARLKKRRVGGF
jgi:hypothetical protein